VAVAETLKTNDENQDALTIIDNVEVVFLYESCRSVAVTTENMVPNVARLERLDAAYSCESRIVGIPISMNIDKVDATTSTWFPISVVSP